MKSYKQKVQDIYFTIEVLSMTIFIFSVMLMLYHSGSISKGEKLWSIIPTIVSVLLMVFAFLGHSLDWFCEEPKPKEKKSKKKNVKDEEPKDLVDFDYNKLAEEKAYLNDFNKPSDVEEFLIRLKMDHPYLNYREAFYVLYLVGRHHKEIYEGK